MSPPTEPRRSGETSPLKLTLAARNAREQTKASLCADPIAIIGMGCRLPGNVSDPEAFWTLLAEGVDAVTEVPPGRWDVEALYDPDPAAPGKSATKWGGYVGDIDRFDAGFFGILRREAERMDPQQRLFLEVAIEALDHAGLARERLAGSRAGVFIASYYNDYAQLAYRDPASIDARTLTGTVHSVLANRLSYLLDLRGPSISVDTACSSSLVAIHLACQSLRFGESDMALAGGVSLMVTESLMISLSKVGFMAPDGRCKSFDASADGFGRGEGCGVVVLKRLSDAVADGDRVLALIRGSAVNQDGHSTVLAAPNGLAQQALIREALTNAQIDASRVGYVEAHGTGTALGDPIEVEALAATVGAEASGAGPCLLGTAKANVGHLEAAAGVTGVIKSVLVLQKGAVPKQVHYSRLNPHISFAGTRLAIPTALTPWSDGFGSRCAGVSGFGVGGTNAHLILEEAPRLPSLRSGGSASPVQMLPLSAQTPLALEALARRWIDFLAASTTPLSALCACAGQRRSHYDHRLGVVGATAADMASGLRAYLDGGSTAGLASGSVPATATSRLAFVFSGQGQQWLGMGRDLLDAEPVFREALVDIDQRFRKIAAWSIIDELAAPEDRSRLDETEVAQPVIFALQVALARLWAAWGYVPEGVVGHSVGEIAALHVAGVIGLDEALRIVCHRGRAMQRATGTGSMVAVALTEAEARRHVDRHGPGLSIAAVNGPRSVVLSGGIDDVQRTLGALDAAGAQHRMLPVDYAFHSAQMEPFAAELEQILGTVRPSAPAVAVYSTVTGERLAVDSTGSVAVDAGYFGRNVRATVRFAAAIDSMLDDGFNVFLELAAHPVLGSSVAECAAARERPALPLASMRRTRPARETLLQAAAWLYATLRAPDWEAINGAAADVVDLPMYPWQRERYWLPEAAQQSQPSSSREVPGGHELLGVRLPAADAAIFESTWPAAAPRWLADHRIGGQLLMPAAAMVEALRAAASHALGRPDVEIADFIVHRALVLGEPDDPPVVWQTTARIEESGRVSASIHQAESGAGHPSAGWRMVASATAAPLDGTRTSAESGTIFPLAVPGVKSTPAAVDVAALYSAFESIGVAFGPSFRVLQEIEACDGAGRAWLARQEEAASSGMDETGLHPTVLDGALQACVIVACGGNATAGTVWLPLGIERYQVFGPVPARLCAQVSSHREGGQGSIRATVRLRDEQGELVALVEGARFVPTSAEALAAGHRTDAWIHELAWQVAGVRDRPADSPAGQPAAWILFCDAGGQGDALAQRLETSGHRCLRIHPQQDLWQAAFEDSAWREGLPLAGVVHLLALDTVASAADGYREASASVSVLQVVQAMAKRDLARTTLTLVTRGAQPVGGPTTEHHGAGLWGLHGVIAVEHPEFDCRIIDLEPEAPLTDPTGLADELMGQQGAPSRLAIRGGQRLVPRLRRRPGGASGDAPIRLIPGRTGTLDGLSWQGVAVPALGSNEIRVRVAAAGVNFRDVLVALGMYPGKGAALGAECAGIVESVGPAVVAFKPGDAVFGFVSSGFATELITPEAFLCKLPADAGLSFERAAALPVAFLTAIVGLRRIAGISAGQRVLIHAAAGGVGMAAIQVARRAGAEVLATAGSESKRQLLRKLGVVHVFDSRSLAFADRVREVTGGAGVDIVLNSLAGEFIAAGVGLLKPGGWFLELGKRDVWSAEQFAQARPDARYRAYDLGDEARADPALVRPMLESLLAGLADGSFVPLPARVYSFEQAPEAFKFMAQARHVGKLVLRNTRMAAGAGPSAPMFRRDASYLISGGLGGLGLETARWLAGKGAGQLFLVGRHGPAADTEAAIAELREAGTTVVQTIEGDVADEEAMRSLLMRIERTGMPLRGVFHAAGTLEDGVLLRQDPGRLGRVFRGKAAGARVLDELTRNLPLDCFVLFSSAAQWLGAPGQGPYAAANAEAEAIVRARLAAGLAGLSVAWGQWRDSGMAARMAQDGNDAWSLRGLGWIGAREGFARLERLLSERAMDAVVLPINWGRFLGRLPQGADAAFFEAVAVAPQPSGRATTVAARADRGARWRALPESQRRGAVLAHATEQALNVLGLDPSTPVDPGVPLKELGLDSLMAVELRNALTRSIGHTLSATLMFDHPSLDALTAHLMQQLKLVTQSAQTTVRLKHDSDAAASVAVEVAGLSDAEAEAQLLAELNGSAGRSGL